MKQNLKIYALDYFLYRDPHFAFIHANYNTTPTNLKNYKVPMKSQSFQNYLDEFSQNSILSLLQYVLHGEKQTTLFNINRYKLPSSKRINFKAFLFDIIINPRISKKDQLYLMSLLLFIGSFRDYCFES